jgi:hypothetical protein
MKKRGVIYLKNFLTDQKGQGIIETTIIVIMFMCAIVFTLVQLSIITFTKIAAMEASQAAVRTYIVTRKNNKATYAGNYVMKPQIQGGNNIAPVSNVSIYNKEKPLGKSVKDDANQYIAVSASHIEYYQPIFFPSLLQPIRMDKFYGGGNPIYVGKATSRMLRSPDKKYFNKSYEGSAEF